MNLKTKRLSTPPALGDAALRVTTVTEMQALTPGDALTVITDGRDTAGDGGGGAFYFVPGSSQPADGGTVLTGNGGRWFRNGWTACGFNRPLNVKWFGAKGDGCTDDAPSIQAAIDSFGRGTGALTRGALFAPVGTYIIGTQLEYHQQSISFCGTPETIIRWNGNTTTAVFHAKDCSRLLFDTLTILGNNCSQPTAGIFFDEPIASSVGTNEYAIVRNVQFGRKYTQDTLSAGKLQRGIWVGGAVDGNNDTVYVEKVQFHDCTIAGYANDNSQSIWGSLRDVVFNACGYGLHTGCNTIGFNLCFNRCTINDFYALRDITVSIFGFNSEHSIEPIRNAQGASIYIDGGKIIVGEECTGAYWCNIQTNGNLSLQNFLVVQHGVSGKKLLFAGSSLNVGSLFSRNSQLPDGDDGTGFVISQNIAGLGAYIDIRHGPYVAQGFSRYNTTYAPPPLTDGSGVTATATCSGIAAGALFIPSFSQDLQGMTLTGGAYQTNGLAARFQNETGKPLDLASGNLSWRPIAAAEMKASNTATYDQALLRDGNGVTITVTVPGANVGDFTVWSHTSNYAHVCVTSWVSAANTISVRVQNETSGTIDPTSGTLKCAVLREVGDYMNAVAYDSPALADAAGVTTTVPLPGVKLGDFVVASFSQDLQGILMTPYVSAADIVSVRFQNETGDVIELASGTLRVMAFRKI